MMKPNVSFGELEIHEFQLILGDNPSVSEGVPLALAPHATGKATKITVDYYERLRRRNRRTSSEDLIMNRSTREQRLLEEGFTVSEIAAAERSTDKLRRSRERSLESIKWDGLNEQFEKTTRSLRKIVGVRSKQRLTARDGLSQRTSLSEKNLKDDGDNDTLSTFSTFSLETTDSFRSSATSRTSSFSSLITESRVLNKRSLLEEEEPTPPATAESSEDLLPPPPPLLDPITAEPTLGTTSSPPGKIIKLIRL